MKRTFAAAAVIGLAILAAPAARAEQTITALGRVVDAQGQPIPDVQVLLDYKGHIVQKYRTKTDKTGVFTHVNVYAGPYRVTLKKEGLGEISFDTTLREIDSLQKPPDYRFVPKVVEAAPAAGSGLAPAAGTPATAPAAGGTAAAPVSVSQLKSDINAAVALSSAGNTDGAIAAYEAINAKTPQVPLVHHNLGLLYQKKGDTTKAMAELQQSLDLDPTFVDGYVGLATVLAEGGKRAEALAVVKKGTAANPQSGRLQYALGVLAEGTGDVAAAKEAFLNAERLDPQNFETQYHLATVALNQNNQAEAVARLQKFIAAAPAGTPTLATAQSLLAALQKK